MHVNEVGVGMAIGRLAPDGLQDLEARDRLPSLTHQQFQQAELHGGELDPLRGAKHLALPQVDRQSADLQRREPGANEPAEGFWALC